MVTTSKLRYRTLLAVLLGAQLSAVARPVRIPGLADLRDLRKAAARFWRRWRGDR